MMALLDLLGRRWVLRVLHELRHGAATFAALQARCDRMSPSVLAQRLAELRETGLIETGSSGYELTTAGAELGALLLPLDAWSKRWASRLTTR
jgi:DNA-binding HxlR family transcriptional regulator